MVAGDDRYHQRHRNRITDWTVRENIRAQLRVIVKRILRKYGYPPDKLERATQTVLGQAELLSAEWAVVYVGCRGSHQAARVHSEDKR